MKLQDWEVSHGPFRSKHQSKASPLCLFFFFPTSFFPLHFVPFQGKFCKGLPAAAAPMGQVDFSRPGCSRPRSPYGCALPCPSLTWLALPCLSVLPLPCCLCAVKPLHEFQPLTECQLPEHGRLPVSTEVLLLWGLSSKEWEEGWHHLPFFSLHEIAHGSLHPGKGRSYPGILGCS